MLELGFCNPGPVDSTVCMVPCFLPRLVGRRGWLGTEQGILCGLDEPLLCMDTNGEQHIGGGPLARPEPLLAQVLALDRVGTLKLSS